ncbi:MAG: NAD(P)H-dependent oxidoreductase [Phycisphaerae bacterium]|nr:NAD(P)H-dependent oxidoreductase [Gemmatimonadaceae bacterium]
MAESAAKESELIVQTASRESVRFLVFSGSLRENSLNTKLAQLAAQSITAHGGLVDQARMHEFDGPSFNQDVEARSGLPAGPAEFCRRIEANDALVIAAPEYNGSLCTVVKNAIDWASRKRPQPFNAKHALLLSASPSMAGGNRGIWALRVPLEHLGARVYPDMFSLAQAHQAFDTSGNLVNAKLQERLDQTIAQFMDLVEAAKHYPCAKKAWIEFLGEHPDPVTDRVE